MDQAKRDQVGMPQARDLAWDTLARQDPAAVAERCGAHHNPDDATIRLPYLTIDVVADPARRVLKAEPAGLTLMEEVLVLRYLCLCDGTAPTGRWISFRELPGGMQYVGPFSGRTARPLAGRFGADAAAFHAAARALGGEPLSFGDASYLFQLLPRLWLSVVLHLGDDEFPAEVGVLFDESVKHQFSTEDCAAAAQVLARRLIRAVPPAAPTH